VFDSSLRHHLKARKPNMYVGFGRFDANPFSPLRCISPPDQSDHQASVVESKSKVQPRISSICIALPNNNLGALAKKLAQAPSPFFPASARLLNAAQGLPLRQEWIGEICELSRGLSSLVPRTSLGTGLSRTQVSASSSLESTAKATLRFDGQGRHDCCQTKNLRFPPAVATRSDEFPGK
jgi:hypothetical protein